MHQRTHRFNVAVLAAIAAVAVVFAGGSLTPAHAQDSSEQVVVGTFDQQEAIKPYRDALRAAQQKIRQNMQQQMQGGGQGNQGNRRQAMQQAQQKMQQESQRIRERYQGDLEEVMPKVADAAGVDVIVPQVSYKRDSVQTKDITEQVIAQLEEVAPKTQPQQPQGMMPGAGQGQGGGQGQGAGQGQGQGQGQGGGE
jgi:hypothetical protein